MVALGQSTFRIGERSYASADWSVIATASGTLPASFTGRKVYRSVFSFGDNGEAHWLIPWRDGYVVSGGSIYSSTQPLAVRNFLANPVAWEQSELERIAWAQQHSSPFHSFVSAIGHVVDQVADVVVDTAEFGLELDEALFHPLTINSNGLQLTNDALDVIPDQLEDAAQIFTSVAGFGVLGAAAVTAVGGFGAVEEIASGVSGALGTAQEVLGAVGSLLPTGVTPILATPASSAAPDGVIHDAAEGATSGLAKGLGPFLLAGFALWLLTRKR